MTDELKELIEKIALYCPIIYNQVDVFSTTSGKQYNIESKFTGIAKDSLIMFVPSVSSVDPEEDNYLKFVIKLPRKSNGNITYVTKTYNMYVENESSSFCSYNPLEANRMVTSSIRKAGAGDIISGRTTMLRFDTTNDNNVIIMNSPFYNAISVNNAIINNCTFINRPKVVTEGFTVEYADNVATTTDIGELRNTVDEIKNKFQYGIEDADTALANQPDGTFYFRVNGGN